MNCSKIEWTDVVWNPVTGCTKVSPGCKHCYAERISHRFNRSFEVTLHPDRVEHPFRWRKPRVVFVNSMSDLFHSDVNDDFIGSVVSVMARTPQHTYQVLTKRAMRMLNWVQNYGGAWPLPNVWLGVSVEDQRRADERIPLLLQTPAAVRFVSAEPLLGAVDLRRLVQIPDTRSGLIRPVDPIVERDSLRGEETTQGGVAYETPGLDWLIAGGESGPGARPCALDWLRSLRDQCAAADVPFFLKQLGGYPDKRADEKAVLDGKRHVEFP